MASTGVASLETRHEDMIVSFHRLFYMLPSSLKEGVFDSTMRSWTTTGSDWQPVRPTEASRSARRLALPVTRFCVADDSTERAVKQTSRSR